MSFERASIMRWVVDRPILELCRLAERRRGTTPRTFWWEQPMDLDDMNEEGNRGEGGRAP